ncbi:hypothetical protein GOQ29_09430 [Clostridium sp. D2Q-14]|uniref:hypothetical protein n=1 Tax=Anaeromonas gelatinilytica TaxID=2683194 RepID=UPI00193C53D7|nr:hypothetical protein [Anaeromonas gelatinilytica]MBS4535835.1 hypothetical protein [Anaeromonas gelatinilytica]
MIDIDKYIDRTIALKINGEVIKIQEPSIKLIKKFTALDGLEDDEILDKQSELVTEILNNNTSAKKFKVNDIDKLPVSAIKAIIESIVEVDQDPN